MQNGVFLLNPLVSNVSRYACLISKLAYRVYKISIAPKLASPKLLFYFWMLTENLSGRYAFQHPYYFGRTFPWNRLNQKMNMILVCAYFKKMNLISLLYLQTNIFQCLINCFSEHNSTVFRRTHKMVQQYRNIMRFMYVFAFTHTYKDIFFTPQAAGN